MDSSLSINTRRKSMNNSGNNTANNTENNSIRQKQSINKSRHKSVPNSRKKSRKVSKIVRFANNVNSNKKCPNGNPIFPPGVIHWKFYLENYDIPLCKNYKYIKYDNDMGKYCCSDTPATLEEMIEHCEYLLDISSRFTNDIPLDKNKIIEKNTNNKYGRKTKTEDEKREHILELEYFILSNKKKFKKLLEEKNNLN